MAESPTNDASTGELSSAELSPADQRLQAFNERALVRMFETMLVVSVLLLGPAFWFYRGLGPSGSPSGRLFPTSISARWSAASKGWPIAS